MTPRSPRTLGGLLVGLAVLLGCGAPPAPARVVLVTIDTLRADRVGVYGGPAGATPHLDELAARGAVFEVAVAPTPVTLPSHASLMTGKPPPFHGVRDNSTFRLEETHATLAERLQAEGFATAAFVGAAVLDRQVGLARGFDVYDDHMTLDRSSGAGGFAERTADHVVEAALAWLSHAPDRFFLWIHLYDPHHSYRPPPEFAQRFPGDPYQGEIAFADAQLGRLLGALERRHSDGRTLVAVTSDHGESLGEHDEPSHSYTIYDATQRIPLLMAGPGFVAGERSARLVRLIDVAPTILARLGLGPLEGPVGRDLWTDLRGSTEPGDPPSAYLEALAGRIHFGWSPVLALRTERYKFIRTPHAELYDLSVDPGELVNRAATNPALVARFDAELALRLADGLPLRPNLRTSEEQRLRLESLGYVVSEPEAFDIELDDLSGPNPRVEMRSLGTGIAAAMRLAATDPQAALARLEPPGRSGFMIDLNAADVAIAAQDYRAAEAYARSAIQERPAFAYAHQILGNALVGQGRTAEARAAFEQALTLDPGAGDPLTARGRLLEGAGDREAAARDYEAATQARAPSAEAFWRLAALHIEDGRRAEAGQLLAQVPAWLRGDPQLALRLARAEQAAGRSADAIRRLEKIADHPEARALLDELAPAGGSD